MCVRGFAHVWSAFGVGLECMLVYECLGVGECMVDYRISVRVC